MCVRLAPAWRTGLRAGWLHTSRGCGRPPPASDPVGFPIRALWVTCCPAAWETFQLQDSPLLFSKKWPELGVHISALWRLPCGLWQVTYFLWASPGRARPAEMDMVMVDPKLDMFLFPVTSCLEIHEGVAWAPPKAPMNLAAQGPLPGLRLRLRTLGPPMAGWSFLEP